MREKTLCSGAVFLAIALTTIAINAKSSGQKGSPPNYPPVANSSQTCTTQGETESGEWEPSSCWDCSQPEEPEALFFTGLFFAIPISVWVIRRKTRKLESSTPKRVLQI